MNPETTAHSKSLAKALKFLIYKKTWYNQENVYIKKK